MEFVSLHLCYISYVVVQVLYIYSEVSDKGHSDEGTMY